MARDPFLYKGDWRQLRDAIEVAIPDWRTRFTDDEKERRWDEFAIVANHLRDHAQSSTCLQCRKRVSHLESYRCADCHMHFCSESCIRAHFRDDPQSPQPAPDPDYYVHFEALSDIVHLMSEEDALNGGGPGFSKRWEAAKRRALELFEP